MNNKFLAALLTCCLLPQFIFSEIVVEENFDIVASTGNKKIYHTIQFRNSGKSSIAIASITPSCGCAVVDWDKGDVLSGETAEINISINNLGVEGIQKGSLVIELTDSEKKVVRYELKVLKLIEMSSQLASWELNEKVARKEIKFSVQDGSKITVGNLDYKKEWIKVEVIELEEHAFIVAIKPKSTEKSFTETISVEINNNNIKEKYDIYACVFDM